jgi:putative MFS transporter
MLFDGFDTGIVSPILPKLVAEWKLNEVQVGLIASAGFIGMAIGSTVFGVIADMVGRLRTLAITLLLYAALTGFCALTTGFTSLFIVRIMVGLGLGGLIPVASSYLAEFMPAKKRGRFMSFFTAANQVGVSLSFFAGLAIVIPYGWRWGFVIGALPALLAVFVWKGPPESVRHLTQKGRIEDAVNIVEKLEKRAVGKITVSHETAIESEKLHRPPDTRIRYRDLFKGGLAKTTIMIAILWFCWGYSMFSIRMWLPILLTKQLHYTLPLALKILTVGSLVGLLGQLLGGYTADYWGRKISIYYSFILFGAAGYFIFWFGKDPTVGAIGIFIWNIALSVTAAASFTYTTEIFPTKVRATGNGFSSSMGRVGGICGPAVVGFILAKLGMTWILHVNMALLVLPLIVVFVLGQETKGKTLEQIGEVQLRKVTA